MSEIAAIRMNSCGQVFYVAKDEESYVRLIRSKTPEGKQRAVFMEDELGACLVHLREFDKEDRVSWMKMVCELKSKFGVASVEAIGEVGSFDSESSFVPQIKTKEQIAREVENARRRQDDRAEPSGKTSAKTVDDVRDEQDRQQSIF